MRAGGNFSLGNKMLCFASTPFWGTMFLRLCRHDARTFTADTQTGYDRMCINDSNHSLVHLLRGGYMLKSRPTLLLVF